MLQIDMRVRVINPSSNFYNMTGVVMSIAEPEPGTVLHGVRFDYAALATMPVPFWFQESELTPYANGASEPGETVLPSSPIT
jgi:hypothetical protein